MRSHSFLVSIGIHLSVFSVNGRRSPGCLLLSLFSPEFSPTCRFFDRQERTWRELSNLFRACEFPGFALFWGCAGREKALRYLALGLPLSSAKRILISGVFRDSQKTLIRLLCFSNSQISLIPAAEANRAFESVMAGWMTGDTLDGYRAALFRIENGENHRI